MTTESGSLRRCHDPSSIFRGAPASVASSRPTRKVTANLPFKVLATGLPLNSRTAHATPGTPRTRVRSVSLRGLVCSQYSVCGSITQTSASVTSRIWLAVRLRMLAKIEVWFSSRNVQKAMAKTRPKYFARSPVSMRKATKFMRRPSPPCPLRPAGNTCVDTSFVPKGGASGLAGDTGQRGQLAQQIVPALGAEPALEPALGPLPGRPGALELGAPRHGEGDRALAAVLSPLRAHPSPGFQRPQRPAQGRAVQGEDVAQAPLGERARLLQGLQEGELGGVQPARPQRAVVE